MEVSPLPSGGKDHAGDLNLDFEAASEGIPLSWTVGGPGYQVNVDGDVHQHGSKSVRLTYLSGNSFGVAAQRVSADEFRGKRVVLKGWMQRSGSSRGVLSLWLRADADNGDSLGFQSMGRDGVASDATWCTKSVAMNVPEDAKWLYFGASLAGDGVAWVDNLELIAEDLPAEKALPLEGHVTTPDGRPATAATVAISSEGSVLAVGQTDAKGHFSFDMPAGKRYSVSATHPDYVATFAGSVSGGQAVNLSLGNNAGPVVVIQGQIKGSAASSFNHIEIGRVSQDEGDIFATPLANARFRLRAPPSPGGYTVQTSVPGVTVSPVKIGSAGGTVSIVASLLSQNIDPAVEALKAKGVELHGLAPDSSPDDLHAMLAARKSVRVYVAGEATHGTKEFFAFKHRLIAYLVRYEKLRVVAIESNSGPIAPIDTYLSTGQGDPRQALRGMGPVFNTEEFLALVEWVRAWNIASAPADQVHFVGIDVQNIEYWTSLLSSFLGSVSTTQGSGEASQIFTLLNDPRRPYAASDTDRKLVVEWLANQRRMFVSNKTAWTAKHGKNAYDEAEHALAVCEQSFTYGMSAANMLQGTMSYEVRERAMAKNASWYADREPSGVSILVWAHNSHSSIQDADGRVNMGGFLRRKYGSRAVVIGFLFGSGGFQAIDGNAPLGMREFRLGLPSPWDVSRPFLSLGVPLFAVDLQALGRTDGGWFSSPHVVREVGLSYTDENGAVSIHTMSHRFDIVVFVEQTSRAAPLVNLNGPPIKWP